MLSFYVTVDGLNMHGDMIADQRVFGRELSEESCSCCYMSLSPK